MATAAINSKSKKSSLASRTANKLWREVSRPVRQISAYIATPKVETVAAIIQPALTAAQEPEIQLTGSGAGVAGFHPQQATVESEAIAFIQLLVRNSRRHPGPIIEIGTLLGITTTNMALAKAPDQRIITVDNYCWNPWGLTPDVHASLTATVLHFLIQTGQVEQVRMDKNEFFRTYRGPAPSLVFLDAVHDYPETKKDIEWARQVGAPMIAGHDYCDQFPGVKQVVDEFGGPREQCASVWLL